MQHKRDGKLTVGVKPDRFCEKRGSFSPFTELVVDTVTEEREAPCKCQVSKMAFVAGTLGRSANCSPGFPGNFSEAQHGGFPLAQQEQIHSCRTWLVAVNLGCAVRLEKPHELLTHSPCCLLCVPAL